MCRLSPWSFIRTPALYPPTHTPKVVVRRSAAFDDSMQSHVFTNAHTVFKLSPYFSSASGTKRVPATKFCNTVAYFMCGRLHDAILRCASFIWHRPKSSQRPQAKSWPPPFLHILTPPCPLIRSQTRSKANAWKQEKDRVRERNFLWRYPTMPGAI